MAFFVTLGYLDPHVYECFGDSGLRDKYSSPCPPEEFVGCQHIEVDQAPVAALYRPISKEVLESLGEHVRGLCSICLREQMLMERTKTPCFTCTRRKALARQWVVSLEVTHAKVVVVCEQCYPRESVQALLHAESQARQARADVLRERAVDPTRLSRARTPVLH